MKRHPEQDSLPTPESKHSRQDIPSPSNYRLKLLREVLKEELQLTTSETTDGKLHSTSLDKIHAAVRAAVISLPETIEEKFVKKEVFKMNIQNQQAHIIQLVRTIMEKSAGEDDEHEERALVTHSICTFIYPPMISVTNGFQTYFGPVHPDVLRVSPLTPLYLVTLW